jgi:hypothetical protein
MFTQMLLASAVEKALAKEAHDGPIKSASEAAE